jgi:putative copper export protein/mono/diheme cytochrome c family protein
MFQALASVLPATQFGHAVLVRFALLLVVLTLLGRRLVWLAMVLAGIALAMQGVMGHAGAAGGSAEPVLLASEALHLAAAGAWLGGLLPLVLLVMTLPPHAAVKTCRAFTPVGLSAVLLIAGTAAVQAWQWIGGLGGLFGTEYGQLALLKLGVFFALLLLAAVNRCVLIGRSGGVVSLRRLRVSIAVETVLGSLVILIAAVLASAAPATHETPVWPFSRRPSLDLLYEPGGARQVFDAAFPGLICSICVLAGLRWRRMFWPSLAAFVVIFGLASPGLVTLLSVEANPTTFATSLTEFSDSSIMHGAALFAANCTSCHGTEGRGDGPAAKLLPITPADLTAPHFWAHTEGDLFWYVSHGISGPSGASAMPGFAGVLSSDERWSLIDFLKAHNAGWDMRTTGRWNRPVQLPQFDAVCANGSAIDLDDLRGRLVHAVAVNGSMPPLTADEGENIATIVLSRHGEVKPIAAACVTIEPATWDTFAILLGVTPDALPGLQVLADRNGWLRDLWRPGDPGNWADPKVLSGLVRDFATHPIAIPAGGGHAHHG